MDTLISALTNEIEQIKLEDRKAFERLIRSPNDSQSWNRIMEKLHNIYLFEDKVFYGECNQHDIVDLKSAAINAAAAIFYGWGPTLISHYVKLNHASCIHHIRRHETRLAKRWEYKRMWNRIQGIDFKKINNVPAPVLTEYLDKLKIYRDFVDNRIQEITKIISSNNS